MEEDFDIRASRQGNDRDKDFEKALRRRNLTLSADKRR